MVDTDQTIIETGLEAIKTYGFNDDLYISVNPELIENPLMVDTFFSERDMTSFIKSVEKLVRSSSDYKTFIGLIKAELNISRCAILSNLEINDDVTLEMHHCPLTLYDVVSIVIEHNFALNKKISTLMIADEVLHLHFKGVIGVVPLTKTIHDLVHNGTIVIHPAMIYGNWLEFVRSYSKGMNELLFEKIKKFTEITEEDFVNRLNKLEYKQITLTEEEKLLLPTTTKIRQAMLFDTLEIQEEVDKLLENKT